MSVTITADVRSLVLEWTECFNRHDPDGAASHMAQDCVFTNVGNGTRIEGRAAFRDDVVNLLAMWSELRIEVTDLLVAGDYVHQAVDHDRRAHRRHPRTARHRAKPFRIRRLRRRPASGTGRSRTSRSTGTWPSSSSQVGYPAAVGLTDARDRGRRPAAVR